MNQEMKNKLCITMMVRCFSETKLLVAAGRNKEAKAEGKKI